MNFEMQGPMGARTLINGREVDYFAGCGYLGLQNHPVVREAAVAALQEYGLANSGGYGGNHPVYQRLETAVTTYFQTNSLLYYASGYLGNSLLAQGLSARYDQIFIDEDAHYSVWDGARTAGKPIHAYRHVDAGHVAELCQEKLREGERPLLMTDGVFPVSGEIAPLPALLNAVEPFGGLLAVDDAHATGVLRPHGWGTQAYFGIQSDNIFTCHTMSKALGAYGGFIIGNELLIEEIKANSNVHEGASRPPMPAAAAATAALNLLHKDDSLRQQLQQNVKQARAGIRQFGWDLPDSPVPILCLADRGFLDLAQIQADLFAQDILIAYSTHYTSVPDGGALRIAIFATHTADQIDRLVTTLKSVL
ncbi:MAG: pyridoxal phosphate-dependent aminotransferase family protein [Anaerolineae bacterium]|nr:pyridoxal phosphate-dependent aminotransferase family protein [Anaerolineae bacterium]